ncbi:MAG: hypothetical protein ACLGIV_04675 [Actinomycetes bacterium]
MSSTATRSADPAAPPGTRPPGTAIAAAGLACLVAMVSAYGAIYFVGLDGYDDIGVTFLTVFLSVAAFAVVSAVALLRGSSHGRVGLVAYGLYMLVFMAMKLLSVQELEAIPFGVVGAAVLVLALHRRTREFTG